MRRPGRRQTFWLLMAASAVAVALPARLLAPLRGLFDPALAPLTAWVYAGGQSFRDHAGRWLGAAEGGGNPKLQAERDEYLVQIIALREANNRLTQDLAQATGLREELKPRGRLIPATVLARDAVSWREAVLIDVGRSRQLKPQQWALAGVRGFIDRGNDASLAEDQLVVMPMSSPQAQDQLGRSVLVGQVDVVGQVTSRVKLLTDFDSSIHGQVYDPRTNTFGALCEIRGQGPGQRLLAEGVQPPRAQAGQRDDDAPPAEPDQLVLTAPDQPNMAGQLVIGVVRKVTRASLSPVQYTLEVTPAVDYSRVRRVFIIDTSAPADSAGGH